MNDKTKCSFVLYGVTTKSIPKIQTLIFEGIRAMMESEYISNEIINKYIDFTVTHFILLLNNCK